MELSQRELYDFVEGVVGGKGEVFFGNEFFEKAGCIGGGKDLLCTVAVGFYKAAGTEECAAEPAGNCEDGVCAVTAAENI